MRTAIFVYQATSVNIVTCESDLDLHRMGVGPTSLSEGENERSIAPGVYKIVSSHDIQVKGDLNAFDVTVTPFNKNDIPPLPPRIVAGGFAPLDVAALQAFFAVPDASSVANP
jgi:hypothetical protein